MATFRQIPVGGILEDTSTKERPHDMATTPRGYTMQRDDYLMRTASGALRERTWPPLFD